MFKRAKRISFTSIDNKWLIKTELGSFIISKQSFFLKETKESLENIGFVYSDNNFKIKCLNNLI